ncbi:hypothetical protein B0H19DRAFT_1077992 [Mycena capillaripes]|nr:hypothetical protein B0H19DRAFT_1077992 [Mycena capillaripes]
MCIARMESRHSQGILKLYRNAQTGPEEKKASFKCPYFLTTRREIDFCALQVHPSCSSVPLQAHHCLKVSMFGVVYAPQVALSFNGASEYWREENRSIDDQNKHDAKTYVLDENVVDMFQHEVDSLLAIGFTDVATSAQAHGSNA